MQTEMKVIEIFPIPVIPFLIVALANKTVQETHKNNLKRPNTFVFRTDQIEVP